MTHSSLVVQCTTDGVFLSDHGEAKHVKQNNVGPRHRQDAFLASSQQNKHLDSFITSHSFPFLSTESLQYDTMHTMMKTQHLSFLVALLAFLCLPTVHATPLTSSHRRETYLRTSPLNRELSETREEYSAIVYRSWGTDTAMSEENASRVADKAKSFITEHIPTPSPGESSSNYPWIGILSVTVVEQATSYTPTGPFLRVKFEIEGTVIAGSSFEEDSLNFDELVNEAIRANDNEFLRLVEPLVVGLEEEPIGPDKDDSGDTLMIVLVIVVSIALVLVLVLFIFCIRKNWRNDESSKATLSDQNKNVPPTVLEEASGNSDQSDSVAERSMYTTAASRKSMNASAILHADNGQSVCSKFSIWSFSAGSDGGDDGDDGVPITDEDPHLIGSNIETVHDLNANDGVFVQINLDEDKYDSEDDMSQDSLANATIGEVALAGKIGNNSGGTSHGKREMDTSPRLGVDDMDEFDNYIDGLPASHKSQSQEIQNLSSKRKSWHV